METAANSIMDYYARISERYYLAHTFELAGKICVGYHWQPLATSVSIPGYEQFDLFIYREGKILHLVESLTGVVIMSVRMQKHEFIKSLPEMLNKKGGISEMNITIVNWLCDHDQKISPRYKCTGV